MNFTKSDLYTSLGVIAGVILAKRYIAPVVKGAL